MTPQLKVNNSREGYVFIITYSRSGATLLQAILNSIEGYCIRGETKNAVRPIARAWDNVRSNSVMEDYWYQNRETAPDETWYGAESISHEALGEALARAIESQVIKPPEGTRVTGFKEVRWLDDLAELPVLLSFLRRFMRPAKFILNTRDHDEAARSGWWVHENPEKVKTRFVALEESFYNYMKKHPDCCFHLHYNDYVADCGKLRSLFDFLGEPFDSEAVGRVVSAKRAHYPK